jgi:predicted nucleic acid-binding protein
MSGGPYLLDTCLVSELMRPEPNAGVLAWAAAQTPQALHLGATTLAELWQGIECLPAGKRKRGLAQALGHFLGDTLQGRVLPFDAATALVLAQVVAERRKRGLPIAFADAQIAATARASGLVLVTRNVKDFQGCKIELLDPWR